jgi:aspartyl aminopeptidase
MTTAKDKYQKLQKQLSPKPGSCWESWSRTTVKKAYDFAEGYKRFLNSSKTESETVRQGVAMADKKGFKDIRRVKKIKPGDKIYFVQKNKSVIFAKIGSRGLEQGMNIVMSHIDAPHLDLKVRPLYEEENLAFFKTHYYGGIKKYQWPTISLALHGTVYLENGKQVDIELGEKEDDPVFMITDLLPHLDRGGGPGSAIKGREVEGEHLNLVVGGIPVPAGDKEKVSEKVKLAVLEYLYKNYGIKEEDLSSAELKAVPSEKARDLGFDRSFISGYSHDDKICSYAALQSLLDSSEGETEQSQVCIWVDREEIGSEGSTGARSLFIESFVAEVAEKINSKKAGIGNVYRYFEASRAISADVTSALDPDYKDVHDTRNAPRLNYGVAVEKYTGAGGKYSTSEGSGEFIRDLRRVFGKDKNVVYQLGGGVGKIDLGGGGTIAKFMANRNIETVDMGVALFNMHAPVEIASKGDLYCAYLAYKLFLKEKFS